MRIINRFINLFITHPYRQAAVVFVLATLLFSWLHYQPAFADPDSFYHVKMTQLLIERGAISEFPWLSATTLRYQFVDHHFLYHLVLIPFVALSPLIGLKIATIFLAASAMVAIFLFLRYLKVAGAFWYAVFLLTVNPFIFRLILAKAQPLVILFLFLFLYLLMRRAYAWLVFVSCLYVWLYAGWPLAFALSVVYAGVNWFWTLHQAGRTSHSIKRMKLITDNALLLFSVGVGLVAGLFFSPYFPKIFQFYWQQTFQIALVNYQYQIGVGAEWYSYALSDLFLATVPFTVLALIALIVFVVTVRRQPMHAWFFLIVGLVFLLMTVKSRRYVEYFIPLAICFSGAALTVVMPQVKKYFISMRPRWLGILAPFLLLLALSPWFYRDLSQIKTFNDRGFNFNHFAEPAAWLAGNAREGDIVFHSDWDEFPMLFYHTDRVRYLVGLDPTFMYNADPDLHRRWVAITTGKTSDNLAEVIGRLFGATYVFVDRKQNEIFDRNLADDFSFERVFENDEARIYRLIN